MSLDKPHVPRPINNTQKIYPRPNSPHLCPRKKTLAPLDLPNTNRKFMTFQEKVDFAKLTQYAIYNERQNIRNKRIDQSIEEKKAKRYHSNVRSSKENNQESFHDSTLPAPISPINPMIRIDDPKIEGRREMISPNLETNLKKTKLDPLKGRRVVDRETFRENIKKAYNLSGKSEEVLNLHCALYYNPKDIKILENDAQRTTELLIQSKVSDSLKAPQNTIETTRRTGRPSSVVPQKRT